MTRVCAGAATIEGEGWPVPSLSRRLGRAALATLVIAAASGAVAGGIASAAAGPVGTVANGEGVSDGGYPFVARLALLGSAEQRLSSPSSVCSGTLIAPDWVVTAGHCFVTGGRRYSGRPPTDPTATVGRADLSGTGGHEVSVVEVRQSPTSDVALARLATPVRDVAPIQPATGPPKAGDVLRIAGWGMTGARPAPLARRMQTGQVKVSGLTDTTVGVKGYAPAATTGACLSDSGAPYFSERQDAQPVLVAVESDGPACPHDQEETTSRIDVLASWLAATMTGSSARVSASASPRRSRTGAPGRSTDRGRWVLAGLAVVALAAGGGLAASVRRRRRH